MGKFKELEIINNKNFKKASPCNCKGDSYCLFCINEKTIYETENIKNTTENLIEKPTGGQFKEFLFKQGNISSSKVFINKNGKIGDIFFYVKGKKYSVIIEEYDIDINIIKYKDLSDQKPAMSIKKEPQIKIITLGKIYGDEKGGYSKPVYIEPSRGFSYNQLLFFSRKLLEEYYK